ncbi:LuxR family maltose regulon positive regulatory protein [Actimicrobium sp. GrIS 1.19]|uniref:LuxR C-terminal-related transcriptional regulator n=1 Tax=Actimicrobium sp. GrIS 1.19 TaxID=3071708 RepID=UPI002E043082|nr:LuxR family maltose regulon positive regulatory protein [Actimicrobium sp. GrIS 1.19]
MSTALLATKFFAPPRPANDISRAFLAKRMDEGLSRKLTLVCAAAGFGKSTLVSQWAQDCPYPSAWLSLDEEDRDPNRFLECLVASLEAISQTVGAGLAALLRGAPPASAETVLTLLVNQLSTIPGKLVLVLDDYHLAASPGVNETLTFLIDHMPAQLHLVIASREEPGIPMGRLRVNGQVTEIRQQDLRFGLEGADEFFNHAGNIKLSRSQIEALETRTEGWISGLKLAAISLRMHKDPDTFIASFTGSHHFVQDYLIEEVLHQQPDEVQSFLLRTSVLDRLCGPLCDAVLQSHGGERMLNQLGHANLFIVPLDSERRWYRYHHLFSDLLRQRLGQRESAAPLHRRASQWYESQGMEVEAFHQSTLANDIAGAMRLIEGNGMPLYFRGVTAPVVHWLSSLTPAVLNTYPFLWVAFSWSLLFAGHPGLLEEKLLAAEAAMACAPEHASTTDTDGQIAVLRAWLAVYRNEAEEIYAQANRALDLLSPESRPARTAAHCALGVAQMFRGERVQASAAFSEVAGAGLSSGNVMFAAVASTALAGIQATDYQLHAAAATYREVIKIIGDPTHVLGFEAHLGLARILYDWNVLDEAESLALHCSELVLLAKSKSEIGADLLRARLLSARHEDEEAEVLLRRANELTTSGQLTDRMREAAELRVLHLLRHGDVVSAAALAHAHQLPAGLARSLLAQGKGLEALRVIESHRHSLDADSRTHDALKAMVVQVIVHHTIGQVDKALQLLGECVTKAQSQRSVRLFLDEGAPMQTMLGQLPHDRDMAPFVSQLLDAFGTQLTREKRVAVPDAATSFHLPLAAFSDRELEILRLIQEGHSNQNIGERLFLSLSTVKWHNQNIFSKLDVQRRTEAVARAVQLKLL